MNEKEMRYFLSRLDYLKVESRNLSLEIDYRPSKLDATTLGEEKEYYKTEIDYIYQADIKQKRKGIIDYHTALIENILNTLEDKEKEALTLKYIKGLKAEAVSFHVNYSIAQTKRIYLSALKTITFSYNSVVKDGSALREILFE